MMSLSAIGRRLALAWSLALLVSCASPIPKPLTAASEEKAYVPATLARCQSEVAALQHVVAPVYPLPALPSEFQQQIQQTQRDAGQGDRQA